MRGLFLLPSKIRMEGPNDDYPLAPYIPLTFEVVRELSGGPIRVFRHGPTGLPVAAIVGGHQGVIIGGIIYTRALDDSMNMEMETPMESMEFTMKFVESQLSETKSRDTVEGLWNRFLDNLFRLLSQKRGFDKNGDPTPVIPTDINIPPAPTRAAPPPVEKDEKEPEECMVCFERAPDTTVTPCMHCVVCAVCSPQLENTGDAKICCQCRQPITGIYYPDNTMKEITE